jgi:hypothetical protein
MFRGNLSRLFLSTAAYYRKRASAAFADLPSSSSSSSPRTALPLVPQLPPFSFPSFPNTSTPSHPSRYTPSTSSFYIPHSSSAPESATPFTILVPQPPSPPPLSPSLSPPFMIFLWHVCLFVSFVNHPLTL